MKAIEIKPNVYWVGARDWKLREFHGYVTQRGSTYNSYLIVDEKVALIDTVKGPFCEEMLERIKSVINPLKIDYIVCNHVEMDHSGSIPELAKLIPNVQILASPNGVIGLKDHFIGSRLNVKEVSGEMPVSLGKKTLSFIHMPMVHWPDSMATYISEERLLLPNDAFGQHYSSDSLFDDENPRDIIFAEAAKYYANIVYPFGNQVKKVVKALSEISFDMIAPSHGVVWRKYIPEILSDYAKWSNNESEKRALVIYDTMWGSTEKLAKTISSVFEDCNIPVTVRSLAHSHYSDVIADVLKSKYILIGTPTLNNEVLPSVAAFTTYMKGLKPKNKTGFVFGSYGWASKAIVGLESTLKELGWNFPEEAFLQKYVPKQEDLNMIAKRVLKIVQASEK